jgi:XTP/dITP diphosphohydrolase
MLTGSGLILRSLDGYPGLPDVVEDGHSFSENALKKARTIAEITHEIVLADDSGLEVEALNGAPGIYSARYAGEGANDGQNTLKLLNVLKDVPAGQRKAVFRCVLALCHPDGWSETFEGRWEGQIAEAPAGQGGFGYDPIFFLPDRDATAAELPAEIKNRISHRAMAVAKLKIWLRKHIEENGA